ncbi:hypothetical protein M3Y98_00649000 [Aphelenchoides besseyi]|nr:hypothetical protein M3Y98_00649000 [Aphelenchoides besseyi]KAI6208660.1 hypothetical protein M3Y96_00138500 [Aphelenchoides besseyi]
MNLTILPVASKLCNCTSTSVAIRCLSTTSTLNKNRAGKHRSTVDHSLMITYEMSRKPHHIGVHKAWLSWHTQNLEEFRQQQGLTVAQDEVIRRFIRGFFYDYRTIDGSEIVIKRRGNLVYITGFLHFGRRFDIQKVYWLFGFVEEFLSQVLKQPVKLELQFVESETDLAYNYI